MKPIPDNRERRCAKLPSQCAKKPYEVLLEYVLINQEPEEHTSHAACRCDCEGCDD